MVGVAWALLVVNTLGSQQVVTVLSIPRPVMQVVTMGSMAVAFVLALLVNPRVRIRPSAYLLLLTLLALMSVVGSSSLESGLGALFRWGRLMIFVATLWLLSYWWDGTLTLVRKHIKALMAVLVTVAAGLVVAPGLALPDEYGGRLVGAVWPIAAPQVGQYAAVAAGLVFVLWLSKSTDARSAVLIGGPAVVLLLLSHTRTATIGLLVGLAVASLSLLLTSVRARRAFTRGIICVGVVAVAFGPAVEAWLQRGQDSENFASLTGRAKTWDALLAAPRTWAEQTFGVGLSNKSFNGLPIDNSWLSVYHEQGLVGVVLVALFVITLLMVAALRPPSPSRACAIFLIVYCIASSYTESGLGDASPYLLHLVVAASLCVPTASNSPKPLQRSVE
ncbi:MAG TPA: O-antigen ligase domain-containing protein [Actinophytocola sp.]|jgi:hypothetical protein|nr:O-antigen ligase domain-containing protein [Actinophytocola sp.]